LKRLFTAQDGFMWHTLSRHCYFYNFGTSWASVVLRFGRPDNPRVLGIPSAPLWVDSTAFLDLMVNRISQSILLAWITRCPPSPQSITDRSCAVSRKPLQRWRCWSRYCAQLSTKSWRRTGQCRNNPRHCYGWAPGAKLYAATKNTISGLAGNRPRLQYKCDKIEKAGWFQDMCVCVHICVSHIKIMESTLAL
jgi:hypothetical protein